MFIKVVSVSIGIQVDNKKFCGGPGGGFSKEPPGRRRQEAFSYDFMSKIAIFPRKKCQLSQKYQGKKCRSFSFPSLKGKMQEIIFSPQTLEKKIQIE
jgi:hypothetical protein